MFISRFNRVCKGLALLVLLSLTLLRFEKDPGAAANNDFPQYYMGGLIARYQQWDALYPIPRPNSLNNPGTPMTSDMAPKYAQLARDYHVGDANRFIQAPPAAFLFVPLTYLPFMKACLLWQAVMAICGWGIAMIAGRFYRLLTGAASLGEGGVVLLTAVVSPAMRRAMIPGNISAAMGLMIALSVYGLIQRKQAGTAGAVLLGGIIKYATAVLLPLALAMRQFKMLLWTVVGGVLIMGVCVAVQGTGPTRRFLSLLPLLDRPWYDRVNFNQSIYGLVYSLSDNVPSPGLLVAIKVAQWTVLAVLLVLIFRRRKADWDQPALVMAAAAALMAWYCIFGPIFWMHYSAYILVFFGWLSWEALHGPILRRAAAALAMLATFVPLRASVLRHQPATTYLLWCSALMFFVAVWRLVEAAPEPSAMKI